MSEEQLKAENAVLRGALEEIPLAISLLSTRAQIIEVIQKFVDETLGQPAASASQEVAPTCPNCGGEMERNEPVIPPLPEWS